MLDIWAVGGDTCTDDAFDFLYQMNENNPNFLIEQVFIVMDKVSIFQFLQDSDR